MARALRLLQYNQIYSWMSDRDASQLGAKIFSLVRLRPECRMVPVRVDFSAPFKPLSPTTSILPVFNQDREYFTPCFLLSSDQKYYQENLAFQLCQFEEKIQRSLQGGCNGTSEAPEQLQAASPHSNYCQICQEKFEDYFQHIQLKGHRLRSSHSEAKVLIEQLCAGIREIDANGAVRKGKAICKKQRSGKRQKQGRSKIRGKEKEINSGDVLGKSINISTCIVDQSSMEIRQ